MIEAKRIFTWLLGRGKYYLLPFYFLLWFLTNYLFQLSVLQIQIYLATMRDVPLDILRSNYPWNYSALSTTLAQWVLLDFYTLSSRLVGGFIIALLLIDCFRNPRGPITT